MSWSLSEWRRRRKTARNFLREFTPITEFAAEDVFIVGFPKSGNTWFQDLVTAVVYGVNPALAPPVLVDELVPDVHNRLYYRRYTPRMFFKSHHLPRPEYQRVVYLMRDGRDAMVSYYHFIKALKGEVNFLELVRTGQDLPGKWHTHINAWQANPYQARMITIKYEDLKRDTVRELERFCAFTGVERDRACLEAAARETVFEKMQKKEIVMGAGNPIWPKDKLFRRRGATGSHKDEMPADVLQAFVADAGETLEKAGYV